MSPGMRWSVGIIGLGAGALFLWLPGAGMIPQNPWLAHVLAAACFLLALIAVPGALASYAMRTLAGVLFLFCTAYLAYELISPGEHTGRSSASLPNALRLFVVLGLPAGGFALSGAIKDRRDR